MTVAGVAIAGALGALARYGIGTALGPRASDPRAFPLGTFVVNLTGTFVLGVLAVLFAERVIASAWLRTSLTVGFLGAYTTFSAFSLETVRLIENGGAVVAATYVVASVVLGVLAAYSGMTLARSI